MARTCMKWALCRSNLHPSMSQNLDGAMNAACDHVMHEFALKALGFMHVMHVMHTMHLCGPCICMSWMLAKCMHIYMRALCAAHACVFIMHALCAVDHHVFHNMQLYAAVLYVMHACVFICLARDSWATRQTQHQRLAGLASTSLPRYVLMHACIQKQHPCVWSMCVKDS